MPPVETPKVNWELIKNYNAGRRDAAEKISKLLTNPQESDGILLDDRSRILIGAIVSVVEKERGEADILEDIFMSYIN